MRVVQEVLLVFSLISIPIIVKSQCNKYKSFVSSVSGDCTTWDQYTESEGWDSRKEYAEISCATKCKNTPQCDYGFFIDFSSCTLPSRCFLMGGCTDPYQVDWTSCSDTIYDYQCIDTYTSITASPTTTTSTPTPTNQQSANNEDDGGLFSDTTLIIVIIVVLVVIIIGWKCLKSIIKRKRAEKRKEAKQIRRDDLQQQRHEKAELQRIDREKREELNRQKQLELHELRASQQTNNQYDDEYDDEYDDYKQSNTTYNNNNNRGGGGGYSSNNNSAQRAMDRKQKDLERKQKDAAKKQQDALKKQQKQQNGAAKKQENAQKAALKKQCKSILSRLPKMNGQNMCPSCGHAFGSGKDNANRKNQHVRKCRNTHKCPCGQSFKNIKKYANHLRSH